MTEKLEIKTEEMFNLVNEEKTDFPKYVSPILNLANTFARGTRPNVVGQMSELIQMFPGNSYEEWKKWYLNKNPDAISKATNKIYEMLIKFREAMNRIDEPTVEKWVKDLVITKTYIGLKYQEIILKKLSEIKGQEYTKSTPTEESKGIDGFIGETPISIKPLTYKTKEYLKEKIDVAIVFYEEKRDGLYIEYNF